jgi:hypothetical protein
LRRARGRERHHPVDGVAHLLALRRRVVALHPLRLVPRDRARHEVVDVGRAGEILERATHAARREPPREGQVRRAATLDGFATLFVLLAKGSTDLSASEKGWLAMA